jgi:hypothetical protein
MESSRVAPDDRNPSILLQEQDIKKLCAKLDLEQYEFVSQPPSMQTEGNGCGPYTVRTLTHMSQLNDQDLDTVLKRLNTYRDAPIDDFVTETKKNNIPIHTNESEGFAWDAFVAEARRTHSSILANYPIDSVKQHLEHSTEHKNNVIVRDR